MELARRNGAVDEGVYRRTRGACAPYKLRRADLPRRSAAKPGMKAGRGWLAAP